MPFTDLWGVSGAVGIGLPDRLLAYLLLLIYSAVLIYLLYEYYHFFRRTTRRQWQYTALLAIAAFILSQFLPIRMAFNNQLAPLFAVQNPVTVLIPFAAAPILLAAAILNPLSALVVGAAGGLGQALGQTHQLFSIFHYAFAGLLTGISLQQNYRGQLAKWARHPVSGGAISMAVISILIGIATYAGYASLTNGEENLIAVDLALSTGSANFWPLLLEGAFGGFIVWLILRGMPYLRPAQPLIPSPSQRSLRRRLISNFLRFAALLTVLLVTTVFNLSAYLATQLVVSQMVNEANAVLAELPSFQMNLQGLVEQHEANQALLHSPQDAKRSLLRQMYRGNPPFYRGLILVTADQQITAFAPDDLIDVSLSEQELTAVADAIRTLSPQVAAAATPSADHVLSLVVPIVDSDNTVDAALVGRVPQFPLDSLIVGLQGTVVNGTGFVVD
jgi:hypothetical protein